jgi:hypothetical protein
MIELQKLSFCANIAGFALGLPTLLATYYESFKARREASQARKEALHSLDCLEFVSANGECINLVPLERLHSLPKPGDVVFLPGEGVRAQENPTGAYVVKSIEHIYARWEEKGSRPQEARLTKTVAQLAPVDPTLMPAEAAGNKA